jgi:homoserine O-acetyltransferase/O-succinyltransferase
LTEKVKEKLKEALSPALSPASVKIPEKMWAETRIIRLDLPLAGFKLVSGNFLKSIEVAYETYGQLNSTASNGILICSPLTTDAHAAGWHTPEDRKPGWWDEMIGPGKAIDTNRYFVISSNMLGGCKGTTGPSSINPETGHPYGSHFPKITVEDMVGVQRLLIEKLGIDILEAVVGGSMGGMQALQWSISYPDKVRKCICIAAAAFVSAQALGFEIIGRKVIVNDPNFHAGDYYQHGEIPGQGLAFARMIGHLTYLSAVSMHEKFGRNRKPDRDESIFETGFEVENYLNHQGDQFIRRFDANSYLHITWAMDHFDLVTRYGTLDKAFEGSKAEYLLVALSSDWHFYPEQTRDLGRVLLNQKKIVSLVELDSPHGHDAFLLEVENLSKVIHGFLEKPGADSTRNKESLESLSGQAEKRSEVSPKVSTANSGFTASQDLDVLASLIAPGSHILDVGCGDGALIDSMYRSHGVTGIGIDFDLKHVVDCLRKNVPVLQTDVDRGLALISDKAFDYAVLNRTLQEVKKPQLVLREMLRTAHKGIVAFPNFAYIGNRFSLLTTGMMPVSEALPYNWHDTPNIHLFSLADFRSLCDRENIQIEEIRYLGGSALSRLFLALGRPNLGAEFVVARISKPG